MVSAIPSSCQSASTSHSSLQEAQAAVQIQALARTYLAMRELQANLSAKRAGEWLGRYKEGFVAHAVWADNVERFFASREISPPELRYRKGEQISSEAGMHEVRVTRQSVCLPEEFIAQHLPQAPFVKIVPDRGALEFRDSKGKLCIVRPGFKVQVDLGKVWEIKKNPPISPDYAAIMLLDERSKTKIDTVLSKAYTRLICAIQSQHPEQSQEQIKSWAFEYILGKRYGLINANHSLRPDLRAYFNRIGWSYGDVVILRGDGQEIVGKDSGSEVSLRFPFQNGGAFFTISLKDLKVLILAPRKIATFYKNSGLQIASIEDLSPEQLQFFQVPERLREN